MAMSRFTKGERRKLRLRMALDGPAGAGKTMTGLRIAQSLANHERGKIAVIDSEHRSASKYLGDVFEKDLGPIDFDVCELETFAPTEYTALIENAGAAGYAVVFIDSLSHAWDGADGALELVDKSTSKNSFTAWKDVTPMHRRMIEAMLASPAHIIATMRSKTEYVLETDANGKQVPVRKGMAPVQRAGMEYEFDIYMSMDWSHVGEVTKSRCRSVDGLKVVKPGAAFLGPVIEWLEKGTVLDAPTPSEMKRTILSDDQLTSLVSLYSELNTSKDAIKIELQRRYKVTELAHLTPDQATDLQKRLKQQVDRKNKPAAASETTTEPTNGSSTPASSATLPEQPKTKNGPTTPDAPAARTELPRVKELARIVDFLRNHAGLTQEVWDKVLYNMEAAGIVDLTDEQVEMLIAKLAPKEAAARGKGTNGPTNGKGGNSNNAAATADENPSAATAAPTWTKLCGCSGR